jgi:mannose-6-phosphate isomerase
MPASEFQQPIVFAPLFMERVWGGRRLEELFGKALPPGAVIGESWEIVDRAEAQSVVAAGPLAGQTLHDLWTTERAEVFGRVKDAPRFPLLIKLLDAQEKLSLQVHPPAEIAGELGGESKTEFWYIAEAAPGAQLHVGLRAESSRGHLEQALANGTVEEHVHTVSVQTGDAMFLPSGRMHAIGGGNVIVEIQENSDTTYRVFDWNRKDALGQPRQLHVEEALRSIDFNDRAPTLAAADDEALVRHELFEVEKWELEAQRSVGADGKFAIVCCLSGRIDCRGVSIEPGGFFLVPAALEDRTLRPAAAKTSLLRVTIPD